MFYVKNRHTQIRAEEQSDHRQRHLRGGRVGYFNGLASSPSVTGQQPCDLGAGQSPHYSTGVRLLDLFCGAGGAAMGYSQAGFTEIVGVDITPQPDYPFRFIQADALDFLAAMLEGQEDIGYGLVHASPPCQRYSVSTNHLNKMEYPDLVAEVVDYLDIIGLPYVVENVPSAPLRRDVLLCGSMFDMQIRRHRVFQVAGFPLVMTPPHRHHEWDHGRPWTVTGHGGGQPSEHSLNYQTREHGKELMDMPWVTDRRGFTEAIPPAYTKFIGEQFLAQ